MSVLVSHPTGSNFCRGVLSGLAEAGLLAEFWTTIAVRERAIQLVPGEGRRRKLRQRSFPEVGEARLVSCPWLEAARQIARRTGAHGLIRHEAGAASVDSVYRDLDRRVARRLRHGASSGIGAVYAYEDGALESFRMADRQGLGKIYDLPIAHWRTLRSLLEEEAERRPDWACTMEGLRDSPEKLARKDEEIARAERIVVASSFTRNSLTDHFPEHPEIAVIPYGCPTPHVEFPADRPAGTPLRLLYAGHLAQRKGIADLIDAVSMLGIEWHLTLAGPLPASVPAALDRFLADSRVTYLGVVPHPTLMEEMKRAHLFVFPSIVEGFAMVVTEAMAAGVPVLTTPHTCGPDILTDGEDGLIVPIRDPEALAERIVMLHDDEDRRVQMGMRALARARQMTWERYSEAIAGRVSTWT